MVYNELIKRIAIEFKKLTNGKKAVASVGEENDQANWLRRADIVSRHDYPESGDLVYGAGDTQVATLHLPIDHLTNRYILINNGVSPEWADTLDLADVAQLPERLVDLQNNITQESLLRQQADTTLQDNLEQEIIDRTNADNAITQLLNNESATRLNADTLLRQDLDNLLDSYNTHTHALNELSDVEITTPQEEQALTYIAGQWLNRDISFYKYNENITPINGNATYTLSNPIRANVTPLSYVNGLKVSNTTTGQDITLIVNYYIHESDQIEIIY